MLCVSLDRVKHTSRQCCLLIILTTRTIEGTLDIIVGSRVHRRVATKYLQSGPSVRRGRHVPLRSRCVCCYARAPRPIGGGRKTKMSDGKNIPNVQFACDVCRVVLCSSCFSNIYDHRNGGKPCDSVILR